MAMAIATMIAMITAIRDNRCASKERVCSQKSVLTVNYRENHALRTSIMSLPEIPAITEKLLAAKKAKGLSFAQLEDMVGRDEVWLAAVFYRQASASEEEALKIVTALGLDTSVVTELTSYPSKGLGDVVPSDPLIYRFYEIMQVYGMPIKEIIHEKFGDGIMSAIDFTLDIEKEEDPKGDRVKVIMNGKFLSYKKW